MSKMSKKQTALEEAIQLIKQDYEDNGRLRLAFVLQTLNKAKGKHRQEIMDAYADGRISVINGEIISYEQYYKENYEQ